MPVPPMFKPLNKYLVQAKKLDKVQPVAAYYCRYYFLRKAFGMIKGKDDPQAKQYVEDLMGEMESMKAKLPESDKNVRCDHKPPSQRGSERRNTIYFVFLS